MPRVRPQRQGLVTRRLLLIRHAVTNAVKAWVPQKAKGPWIAASADVSGKG